MFQCQNKIALVTGASRGIGQAILLQLAKQGAIVVGTATTQNGAENITKYITDSGSKGRGHILDVNDGSSINKVLDGIQEEFGAIDILINNAGITRDNLLLRMKDEQWDEIIATNLTSVFKLTRACIKSMLRKRSGKIISISSVVGSMGNPGQTNYAAAKAGIEGFTRALAREVGKYGITANVVAPGMIDTDMTRALSEEHRALMQSMVPMERLGLPEEIAAAVGFLASDAASYITGETLHVNGGMYMA